MQFLKTVQFALPEAEQCEGETLAGLMDGGAFDGEIVQYSHNAGSDRIKRITTPRSRLMHIRYPHEGFITAAQRKGFVNFTMPLDGCECWTVNGKRGLPHGIFINYDLTETKNYAPHRNAIVGGLKTELFLSALARLGGVCPDADLIPRGLWCIDPATWQDLAACLLEKVYAAPHDTRALKQTEDDIATVLVSALMAAKPVTKCVPDKQLKVFDQVQHSLRARLNRRIALSAMCDAADVSAPTRLLKTKPSNMKSKPANSRYE